MQLNDMTRDGHAGFWEHDCGQLSTSACMYKSAPCLHVCSQPQGVENYESDSDFVTLKLTAGNNEVRGAEMWAATAVGMTEQHRSTTDQS
jgi:hypothetical protein